MRFKSRYRTKTETLSSVGFASKVLGNGGLRIQQRSTWNANLKHYFLEIDPDELIQFRHAINARIAELSGYEELITLTAYEYELLLKAAEK